MRLFFERAPQVSALVLITGVLQRAQLWIIRFMAPDRELLPYRIRRSKSPILRWLDWRTMIISNRPQIRGFRVFWRISASWEGLCSILAAEPSEKKLVHLEHIRSQRPKCAKPAHWCCLAWFAGMVIAMPL